MSLWWVQRNQLDGDQLKLIEELPLRESFLILGPPGSGKTNVLLRRAQFIRSQQMPNVLVLTFTRSLTEFVRTGCYDGSREIFPPACVTTLESWMRWLHKQHGVDLPEEQSELIDRKRLLAVSATNLQGGNVPKYDALFIDEAQDLLEEEVTLLKRWSNTLFFVGDDRQKLFKEAEGLDAVRKAISKSHERTLSFHYRLAPEICRAADRIMVPVGTKSLESSCHYKGPTPASVRIQPRPMSPERQLEALAVVLQQQVRVYGDLLERGDRIGVITARRDDRDQILHFLESIAELSGKAQIIRAREIGEQDFDTAFDSSRPISILTIKGCKGLEFRSVHWMFAERLKRYHDAETYYTVVTRAKTSLDVYYSRQLPQELARAHADTGADLWGADR